MPSILPLPGTEALGRMVLSLALVLSRRIWDPPFSPALRTKKSERVRVGIGGGGISGGGDSVFGVRGLARLKMSSDDGDYHSDNNNNNQ